MNHGRWCYICRELMWRDWVLTEPDKYGRRHAVHPECKRRAAEP